MRRERQDIAPSDTIHCRPESRPLPRCRENGNLVRSRQFVQQSDHLLFGDTRPAGQLIEHCQPARSTFTLHRAVRDSSVPWAAPLGLVAAIVPAWRSPLSVAAQQFLSDGSRGTESVDRRTLRRRIGRPPFAGRAKPASRCPLPRSPARPTLWTTCTAPQPKVTTPNLEDYPKVSRVRTDNVSGLACR